MKINLVKVGGKLIPASDEDKKYLAKFADGEVLNITLKKTRNYRFLSKYYSLLRHVFSNLEQDFKILTRNGLFIEINSVEDLHFQIKMMAGLYEKVITWGGNTTYKVKSINFDKMDEIEFSIFYETVFAILQKYFYPYLEQDKVNHIEQYY